MFQRTLLPSSSGWKLPTYLSLIAKTVYGHGCTAPYIPGLGTRWKWVVSFMILLFYPGKDPDTHCLGPRTVWMRWLKLDCSSCHQSDWAILTFFKLFCNWIFFFFFFFFFSGESNLWSLFSSLLWNFVDSKYHNYYPLIENYIQIHTIWASYSRATWFKFQL
jgi:hypothetical protein